MLFIPTPDSVIVTDTATTFITKNHTICLTIPPPSLTKLVTMIKEILIDFILP